MNNVLVVAVLDGGKELEELAARLLLLDAPVDHQVVVQLTPRRKVHDKVEVVRRLEHLVKADDVWVVELLHDAHLAVELTERLGIELRFVNDLDGDLGLEITHEQCDKRTRERPTSRLVWRCRASFTWAKLPAPTCREYV